MLYTLYSKLCTILYILSSPPLLSSSPLLLSSPPLLSSSPLLLSSPPLLSSLSSSPEHATVSYYSLLQPARGIPTDRKCLALSVD